MYPQLGVLVRMGIFTKKEADEGQSKSEVEALLEAFGAKLNEQLTPLRETVTTLKTKWDAMEAEVERAATPDPGKHPDGTELTEGEKLSRDNKVLLALNVQTNARITERDCVESIRSEWPQLIPQFLDMCAKTPVEVKARTDYAQLCANAIDQLVGKEARKGGLRFDKQNGKFLIEDGVSRGEGEDNALLTGEFDWTDPNNSNHHLTGIEQLRKLGITDPKEIETLLKTQVA